MKLSPHFTLEEFCASQTAARLGIDNSLPAGLYPAAKRTVQGLEDVRTLLRSNAIHISSGYRCPALNKAVGSKPTSQHQLAEAVDFTCPTFGSVNQIIEAIVQSKIKYDQLISEYAGNGGGWVHISFNDNPRKMALIIDSAGTRAHA
jgi:zinc D-Ala-D-Ala carboxypeptidase